MEAFAHSCSAYAALLTQLGAPAADEGAAVLLALALAASGRYVRGLNFGRQVPRASES